MRYKLVRRLELGLRRVHQKSSSREEGMTWARGGAVRGRPRRGRLTISWPWTFCLSDLRYLWTPSSPRLVANANIVVVEASEGGRVVGQRRLEGEIKLFLFFLIKI